MDYLAAYGAVGNHPAPGTEDDRTQHLWGYDNRASDGRDAIYRRSVEPASYEEPGAGYGHGPSFHSFVSDDQDSIGHTPSLRFNTGINFVLPEPTPPSYEDGIRAQELIHQTLLDQALRAPIPPTSGHPVPLDDPVWTDTIVREPSYVDDACVTDAPGAGQPSGSALDSNSSALDSLVENLMYMPSAPFSPMDRGDSTAPGFPFNAW